MKKILLLLAIGLLVGGCSTTLPKWFIKSSKVLKAVRVKKRKNKEAYLKQKKKEEPVKRRRRNLRSVRCIVEHPAGSKSLASAVYSKSKVVKKPNPKKTIEPNPKSVQEIAVKKPRPKKTILFSLDPQRWQEIFVKKQDPKKSIKKVEVPVKVKRTKEIKKVALTVELKPSVPSVPVKQFTPYLLEIKESEEVKLLTFSNIVYMIFVLTLLASSCFFVLLYSCAGYKQVLSNADARKQMNS